MKKYLGDTGLRNLIGKIKGKLDEKADKAELAIQTNQNLLDNWYFAGSEQFPINQKGNKTYENKGIVYSIDRWLTINSAVTITGDCISLHSSNEEDNNYSIMQYFEHPFIVGQAYTLSFLTKENVMESATIICPEIDYADVYKSGYYFQLGNNLWGHHAITLAFDKTIASSTNLVAVKLELGDHQTLAHKEGDKWVLNEIPDYGTELAKCQRYQLKLMPYKGSYTIAGSGIPWTDTTIFGMIPIPTTLRVRPTVQFTGNVYVVPSGKSWQSSPKAVTISASGLANNMIYVQITGTGFGTNPCAICLEQTSTIETYIYFDANL